MMKVQTIALFAVLVASAAQAAEEERKDYRWEFPASGATTVVLPIYVGDVRVVTDRREGITIRATRIVRAKTRDLAKKTIAETPVLVESRENDLRLSDGLTDALRSSNRTEDAPSVDLQIEVHAPAGIALAGSIGVGSARIGGNLSTLSWQNSVGNVSLEGLRVQKRINVKLETGTLDFSGSIGAGEARLSVGAGAIRATLDATGAEYVGLQTQVGPINAQFKSAPKSRLDASTVVGDISVRIPLATTGDALVSAQTGTARSDFALPARPRAVGDTGGWLSGPLGKSSGFTIQLKAGIGAAALEKG